MDCIVTYHYYQSSTEATVVTEQQQLSETSNWSSPDSGFEEQLVTPHIKIVSVEMEAFDVISVQMQEAGKRNRDEDNEDQQTKRFKLNEDEGNT